MPALSDEAAKPGREPGVSGFVHVASELCSLLPIAKRAHIDGTAECAIEGGLPAAQGLVPENAVSYSLNRFRAGKTDLKGQAGHQMSNATLDGAPIAIEAAYQHAARLLGDAKFPVVAGLGTDVAGARAAILLAERLRGAFDHLASDELLSDLNVMRSFGMFTTTPNEARLRADVALFVGPGLVEGWPALFERLALEKPAHYHKDAPRKVFWLGPKRSEGKVEGLEIDAIPASSEVLPSLLAALRARVGGRPAALEGALAKRIDALAEALKTARFGVAVWSASSIDGLAIEALQGLLTDLNLTTRFSGLPLGARSDATGIAQVSGWMTGFPPRTGFGRGYPEHDPWRFDARRLVESGEADAALWISAYDGEPPRWSRKGLPLVTLAPKGAASQHGLFIEVGRPGEDHDALEFAQEIGAFALRQATAPGSAPSVAEAIRAIDAKISENASC
jgi:formylmethanofuran dehydrogenase subunit B